MTFLQKKYSNDSALFCGQRAGFTLMEMMVVISIIGILTAIALASLNAARESARDSQRRADLQTILVGLSNYATDHSTYQVEDSGSSNISGGGAGYFSYINGSNYQNSVARALAEQNYLPRIISDPLVPHPEAVLNDHRTYMIYPVVDGWLAGVCMFAQLEDPSEEDVATVDNAPIGSDRINTLKTSYNMNYAVCN